MLNPRGIYEELNLVQKYTIHRYCSRKVFQLSTLSGTYFDEIHSYIQHPSTSIEIIILTEYVRYKLKILRQGLLLYDKKILYLTEQYMH
jgi:hypothetical protein